MSIKKSTFRFPGEELEAAHIAAAKEGVAVVEFVRRAVADRVSGAHGGATNSAGVNDAVRRLAALVDQLTIDHAAHKQAQDEAMVKINKAGQGLLGIELRMTDKVGGAK